MADLSGFATKKEADEGVVLPVKIKGKKLPLAIKLFGGDSDVVKEYERSKIRKLGLGKKGKNDLDEDDIDELLDSQDDAVLIRIGGVYSYDWDKEEIVKDDPVQLFGRIIQNDKVSYKFLIENIPALKDWILETSNERDNFLSAGKKN